MNCQQLTVTHKQAWHSATNHPFLLDCRSGNLKPAQFNRWLEQDYLFGIEFTRFFAATLQAAPPNHFDILLSGLTGIKAELCWFHTTAKERNLSLHNSLLPACEEYCRFLIALSHRPYPVLATILWGIENTYSVACRTPIASPYDQLFAYCASDTFKDYVHQLEQIADEALTSATEETQSETEAEFLIMCRHEKAFWQMAYEAVA